jgi:hypothetical protein
MVIKIIRPNSEKPIFWIKYTEKALYTVAGY